MGRKIEPNAHSRLVLFDLTNVAYINIGHSCEEHVPRSTRLYDEGKAETHKLSSI